MPGPLDALKGAAQWATSPLVSKEAIQPAQDMLDSPTLDRSPLEAQVRGFGAGALEGLRGLVTPLNIASLAAGPLGRVAGAGAKAAAPTLDLVEAAEVPQSMPTGGDVDALTGMLKHNLAKVPGAKALQAPPEVPADVATRGLREFVPPGAEESYNAFQPAQQASPAPDPRTWALRNRFALGTR